MKDQISKRKPVKQKFTAIFIFGAAALIVGVCLTLSIVGAQKNYAQDTANPLEASFSSAGASKACSSGNSGRGADNRTPYYGATFMVAKDKEAAAQLANKVAADNGYSLTHASSANRGFLTSVADQYINDWYFDQSSKDSSYGDLGAGKVKLSVVVYGEGEKNDCDQSIIPAGHSTIGIGVRLPEYK